MSQLMRLIEESTRLGLQEPCPAGDSERVLEAVLEGIVAARALASGSDRWQECTRSRAACLVALALAWDYVDRMDDLPADLHLALGDWASALMEAERRLKQVS